MFLAMTLAATIVALYAVPSTYGRLGSIVGEGAVLIFGVAVWLLIEHCQGKEDILRSQDILAYMIG